MTGVVFGLAPALQAARRDLFESLKDAARGSTEGGRRSRLRNALVIGEIALAVVVLVGASLFVRTFRNFENARGGLPTKGLITMRVFLSGDRYATPDSQYQRAQDLVQRVEAIPGVAAAMASQMSPFGNGGASAPVVAEGAAVEKGKEPNVLYFGVTPHLLKTIDQTLIAGRDFTDAEGQTKSHVAIVNRVFAKQLWPMLAIPGVLLGVIGGLIAAPVVRSILYNVSPVDPLSFVGTAAFLLVVALAASYFPARRAMSVDPMIALRAE